MPEDHEKPHNADPSDPVDRIATGGYTGTTGLGAKHLGPTPKSADSELHRDSSWKTKAEEEPEELQGDSSQ